MPRFELIDDKKGEIKLRVNDEEVIFNMNKALKYPRDITDCFRVDMFDEVIQETLGSFSIKEPLATVLLGTDEIEEGNIVECKKLLEASLYYSKPS